MQCVIEYDDVINGVNRCRKNSAGAVVILSHEALDRLEPVVSVDSRLSYSNSPWCCFVTVLRFNRERNRAGIIVAAGRAISVITDLKLGRQVSDISTIGNSYSDSLSDCIDNSF